MLLWPAFWNDLQDPLETRETGKYCNHAARARTRSTVLEVLKKTSTRNDEAYQILVVETDGRSNDQAKYPPKRYVYSEILVFASEKASIRNDEACEILLVENPEKRNNAKKPTRQISTTKSVSRREAKNRVSEKEAPELRLSTFQSRRNPTGTQITAAEKTINLPRHGISSN